MAGWPVAVRLAMGLLALFLLPSLFPLPLSWPGTAQAVLPEVRQILVVDAEADPLRSGDPRGAVFLVSTSATALYLGSSHVGLVNPVSAAIAPDRVIYVVDADADPLRLGRSDGCLWSVDPADRPPGTAKLAAASALFRRPADLLIEPEGTVLLVDSDADPNGWGNNNGAVFRVDPRTGQVEVLAAPAGFSQPRCLAWDIDGQVLVLDQSANPQGSVYGAGAIFHLNRHTGAIAVKAVLTRPRFASPSAVAVIPSGAQAGDLLVVDKDADPDNQGDRPGAVFLIPKRGGQPSVISAFEDFAEPIDVILGLENDFIVLDKDAIPEGVTNAQGAIFRFDLLTGNMMQRWMSVLYKDLSGLSLVEGASVDSSTVTWTDEDQGLTQPGDFITVRAVLRNNGTEDAPVVSLVDTLSVPWNYVYGSDSVSVGETSYDPANRIFLWRGSLAVGEEARVRYRTRLSDQAPAGQLYTHGVTLRVDESPKRFRTVIRLNPELPKGTVLYADFQPLSGRDEGRIYRVDPDSTGPIILYRGGPLRRPSDIAMLDDGRLAILDRSSPNGPLGAIVTYSADADTAVPTLLSLSREDGFVQPSGIAVDGDGNLLIIDRDANPNGYPAPNNAPGAVFKLDLTTHELSVVRSEPDWKQPLDAARDQNGRILVIDLDAGAQGQGALYEFTPGATPTLVHDLPSTYFRDPVSVLVDSHNTIYIADPNSPAGNHPRGGAVLRLERRESDVYSIVTADTLLRQPGELAFDTDGSLLIADREANPMGYVPGDRGAILRVLPGSTRPFAASANQALRSPDGLIILQSPDLSHSAIETLTPGGLNPVPGDTTRLEVTLVNSATVNAAQVLADLRVSENLTIEAGFSSRGDLVLDPVLGRVTWSGRLANGDTLRFAVRARIDRDAVYGANVGAAVTIYGGGPPFINISDSRTLRAPFATSDLLLVDEASNSGAPGVGPGAIFRLPGEEVPARFLYTHPAVRQLSAMEWNPAGDLILATMQGTNPGRLYRFDTVTGGVVQIGAVDSTLRTPTDLAYSNAGDLYVVDQDARVSFGGTGAIFKMAGGTPPLTVFSTHESFRAPVQMAFGPGNLIYVTDRSADPEGRGGNTGAIWTLGADGRVLSAFQETRLTEPTGIIAYDDSSLVITDPLYRQSAGVISGALFRYFPATRRLDLLMISPIFRYPYRSALLPTGEVLILDREAAGPGQGGSPGVVLAFHPKTRHVGYYAWSDSFSTLSDVVQRPGPLLDLSTYAVTDGNGAPLHPADRLQTRVVLRNFGPVAARNASWVDTLPPEVSLVTATAEASTGELTPMGTRGLTWTGDVGPADSVVIRYEVQLNPAMAQGKLLRFESWLRGPVVRKNTSSVSLQTYVPLEPGYIYLLDKTSNPRDEDGVSGALFKINMVTGGTVPMFTSSELVAPRSVALVGNTHPQFLILDESSTVGDGRGALYIFDPAVGQLRFVASDRTWLRPTKVIALGENEALILDSMADPRNLTLGTGPGAIYRVNLDSGVVTFVYSDTLLKSPSSIALMRSGLLAIADEDADPARFGSENGALFTLDMETSRLRVLSASPLWRSPRAINPTPDGGLILLDDEAVPVSGAPGRGSVFTISRNGVVTIKAVSAFFTRLADVQVGPDGDPILVDSESDPFHYGQGVGAVFLWDDHVFGNFVPLGSSPDLRTPISFEIYRDPTPAGILEAVIEAGSGGIAVSWNGPPAEEGNRYLLYRRQASGPEDPGDPTPIDYDLVPGTAEFWGAGPHRYVDSEVEPGAWYVYLITQIDPLGDIYYSSPLLAQAPPSLLRLEMSEAAPNPFREVTTLRYVLPARGSATLEIHDVSGRRVRTLVHGEDTAGPHTVLWDGRDEKGHSVASGVYFSRLEFRRETRTARLVLLR